MMNNVNNDAKLINKMSSSKQDREPHSDEDTVSGVKKHKTTTT